MNWLSFWLGFFVCAAVLHVLACCAKSPNKIEPRDWGRSVDTRAERRNGK